MLGPVEVGDVDDVDNREKKINFRYLLIFNTDLKITEQDLWSAWTWGCTHADKSRDPAYSLTAPSGFFDILPI